ncbi:MAG: caspase family protein [Candidatus Omnitrophica bacterium]|nr:caspase family protein [Candidatus Omnitrophota bacterium]
MGPFSNLRLGIVYTDNTLEAFEYMKRHRAQWHRKVVPFLEKVDSTDVVDNLDRIGYSRFKETTHFETLEEAVKREVDLILLFDYRCSVAQQIGGNTTVDISGTFMNRHERVVDIIKGSGLSTPPYFSFTFQFGKALKAAFNEFLDGMDSSPHLRAFAERRVVPAAGAFRTEGQGRPPRPSGRGHYEKSWAVVLGINRYQFWPPLEYAVADARAVAEELKAMGFDEIIQLLDQDASREKILTLLGVDLPKKVGPEDRVVIFFAGHGQTESLADGGEQGYIIPADARQTNYFATAISMTQVRELSQRIPAKHLLYVMDACYSGHGFTRASGLDPLMEGYVEKITALRAVQMITAGGKDEQVAEREGHGIFTLYLLRGLAGEADRDADGVITASELGAYLMPQVSRATDNHQTPQYGRLDGEGEVVFTVPSQAPESTH